MKSRISSCKAAAFGKDLTRFWPVWVGYILCLMIVQLLQSNDDLSYWYAANMGQSISVMSTVNLCYGCVAAMTLFGDLFQSRLCNGLHAMPMKREHWFAVHIRAGLLFSLFPTALIALFSGGILCLYSQVQNAWQIPLLWFAATNLQYLFFFGLAVFCAMCVGSRFAMAVVYGLMNFFSILVYLLVDQLYTPLLKGVTTMSRPFEMLCPVWQILNSKFIDVARMMTAQVLLPGVGYREGEYIGRFNLVAEGWIYVGILVPVGIGLLLAARQMYKKRHLECAGDFLAMGWLEPVFQVVFTVLCAAGFHGVFMVFFGIQTDTVSMFHVMGLIIGWFGGRMLLERTTKVFRVKNFAGFALIAAVMAGSMYVTHLDPLGIETWIPKVGETQSATLRLNYRNGYTTEDPVEIAELTRLHELALEQNVQVHPDYDPGYFNPYDRGPEAAYIILQYENKNGSLSQRNYYILTDGESGELMRKYCSRLDVVLNWEDVKSAEDLRYRMQDTEVVTVGSAEIPAEFLTEEFCNALADAIAADCEAGNMVQSGVFHTEPVLRMEDSGEDQYYLTMDIYGGMFWGSFCIYADCENILKVLEPTGILVDFRQDSAQYLYG